MDAFDFTLFRDRHGTEAYPQHATLGELAETVRSIVKPAKDALPLVKLGIFGDVRTARGSLRHDANLQTVTGTEADYDAGELSFDEAVEIAEKADLHCLIYTSPSCTVAKPRWRILAPFSQALPPDQRDRMMNRLAGLYGGIFGPESWVLSQCFYIGRVDGSVVPQTAITPGETIDLMDELDQTAIGKPHTAGTCNSATYIGPVDEQALIEAIVKRESYHVAAMRLLGCWARKGVHLMEAEARLHMAFECVAAWDRDDRWHQRYASIPEMLTYVYGKEASKVDEHVEFTLHGSGAAEHTDPSDEGVRLANLWAYMPQHRYMFAPTRELWPAESVNGRIAPVPVLDNAGNPVQGQDGKPLKIRASVWLDQNRAVEQMTWCPGLPMIVEDRLVSDGGWIDRAGVRTFNLYRPPNMRHGDPAGAQRWCDHVNRVFPDEAQHIIAWLAQRVQRPEQKINHGLLWGGCHGIGKDTILEPLKCAIGPWNFQEVSPEQVMGRFNGFQKAVILRINEAHDLGNHDRYSFYDRMKAYLAAPPDVLRCDEKNIREYAVFNVCGVILTTNHKTSGVYLPADDRRHHVAWSDLRQSDFPAEYWKDLYAWYDGGGAGNVAAYLAQLDLSGFDPKAPPPKTGAFWEIVNANQAPENAELADALDALRRPDAVTIPQIARAASDAFREWLMDRRNSRVIPHRLEECGYVAVRNNAASSDGRWVINGRRQVVYAKSELTTRERYEAAVALAERCRAAA
jgi:hypothetical protein